MEKTDMVSIIITTYNSAENLRRTLNSIEMQDYPAIQVCIKDGGSKDGTVSVIREYEHSSRFPVIWSSGADEGIYDAMNHGYSLSSGKIVVFFSDLFLRKDAVSHMVKAMKEQPDCVGACADLVYATEEKVVRYWRMGPQKSIYSGWMPGHPTLFLKREVYAKYGLYDTSYRIAADYEFMVRFLKDHTNRLAYVPETIIRMYYGGTSTGSTGSYLKSLQEGHRALKKNGIKGAAFVDLLRTMRVLSQFLPRKAEEE